MKKGFTLVELSIVLVIIGLLIGGILVGQSLIESVKVRKLIQESEQYTIQIRLFKEKFLYLPGDFPNFVKTFGDTCDKRGGNTYCNGDGNGYIKNIGYGQPMEELRIFEHMYRSGIVQKIYLAEEWWATNRSNPISFVSKSTSDTDIWALSYYSTYPSGGHAAGSPNVSNPGHYFNLRPSRYGTWNTGRGSIEPSLAMALDGKLDDGMPKTGDVRAYNPRARTCIAPTNPATYLTNYTNRGCNMYVKIRD